MKHRNHHFSGFTIIEMIVVITIIAMGAAGAVYFYKVAQDDSEVSAIGKLINTWAVEMRTLYASSGSYASLANARLGSMRLIKPPLSWNASTTVISDNSGARYEISGSGAGATPSLAIQIYGIFGSFTRARCIALAGALATSAEAVHIGSAASASSGIVSGGHVFKSASVAPDFSAVTTGCSEADPKIALQYR